MTYSFARSHDNAKFASSGGDRSVFLWDVASGVTTRRISGHMGKIHVVEFNAEATVVASGMPFVLSCSTSYAPSDINGATGSFDSTVRLWDLRYVHPSRSKHNGPIFTYSRAPNRQAIQVLDEARDAVQTLHVGSATIITGSVDGYVRTYDLRKGELRADYIGRELS